MKKKDTNKTLTDFFYFDFNELFKPDTPFRVVPAKLGNIKPITYNIAQKKFLSSYNKNCSQPLPVGSVFQLRWKTNNLLYNQMKMTNNT
jgi:hypothetical protein